MGLLRKVLKELQGGRNAKANIQRRGSGSGSTTSRRLGEGERNALSNAGLLGGYAALELDREVAANPRRRLVEEAEHAMFSSFGRVENQEGDDTAREGEEEFQDFQLIYDTKVKKLQDEAGGKDHIPISGNLYMYRALSAFGEESGLFLDRSSWFVSMGLNVIMITQILGPIFIIASAWQEVKIGPSANLYLPGSEDRGITNWGSRVLSVLFLVLFCMNGLYVLSDDRNETKKLIELSKLFHKEAESQDWPKVRESWFWIGAIINTFCLITSSIAMVLVFVGEDGPSDTVLDAFGLTFLYNLDDIGGDLGFLDEKWDEDQMGDIYGVLADKPEMLAELEEAQQSRQASFTPDDFYGIGEKIMWVLLFVLPIVFLFLDKKEEGGKGRRLESPGRPVTEETGQELLMYLKAMKLAL